MGHMSCPGAGGTGSEAIWAGLTICRTTCWHMFTTGTGTWQGLWAGACPLPCPSYLVWNWVCMSGIYLLRRLLSGISSGHWDYWWLLLRQSEKAIWGDWPSLEFKFTSLPVQLEFISSAKGLNCRAKYLRLGLGMCAVILMEKASGLFS